MRSYKGGSGPTGRPAMSPPARVRAREMPQQTTDPEPFNKVPGLEAADASYSKTSRPEARPRAARRASRTSTKKRHLDDSDREAKAEEPLHKRPWVKTARLVEKETTAQERTSSTRRRVDYADNHAKTEPFSEIGRKVYQHTLKEPSRYQERSNLSMDIVESTVDGRAEAKQRRKTASVESSSIAPVNITMRSSVFLQNSDSSRSGLGTPQKKVRFEDRIPGKAPEELASLGSDFEETTQQMVGTGPQLRNATQWETLNQPADADVIMVDVGEALSALSFLHVRQ